MSLALIKKEVKKASNPEKAKILQGFFKTGKGEYGEGDIFAGITVPQSREIAKKYYPIRFSDLKKLLQSKIHEERLIAVLILVHRFQEGDVTEKKKTFDFYLKSTSNINNWDLVDLSADKIVGAYLYKRSRALLRQLTRSKNLWEQRISIIATFYFIKKNDFNDTLEISQRLLHHDHDLIHKAVGWMLREVGKRNLKTEEGFLKKHYKDMPRTMLRYAIERFPEKKRQAYLKGEI